MTRPLSFDRLYDLRLPPLLPSLEVSPDGERVAFVVDEFDREENERLSSVFVAPTDGSRDPHRLWKAISSRGRREPGRKSAPWK